jgi:hypothetical protein
MANIERDLDGHSEIMSLAMLSMKSSRKAGTFVLRY